MTNKVGSKTLNIFYFTRNGKYLEKNFELNIISSVIIFDLAIPFSKVQIKSKILVFII